MLQPWDTEPGDVTYESWVGKLENVNEEVTLTFPDGARLVNSLKYNQTSL